MTNIVFKGILSLKIKVTLYGTLAQNEKNVLFPQNVAIGRKTINCPKHLGGCGRKSLSSIKKNLGVQGCAAAAPQPHD